MASIVKWYIDPNASGGGTGVDWTNAYNSLSAFETAEAKDISTGSGSDEIYRVNVRSSAGGDDATTFRWDGHTTDETGYIIVTGDSADGGDFPTDGIWDETKYLLHNDDSASSMVDCRQDYIRWEKIQLKTTHGAGNARVGLLFVGISPTNNDIRIDNCFFKGSFAGGGGSLTLLLLGDVDIVGKIWNTIIALSGGRGMDITCSSATIYNCIVYGADNRGIHRASGTVDAINCAVFNCNDDFTGTWNSITYCATDDDHSGDSGTNVQITQSADDWAALVVDAAGDDFNVTDASSELYNTGNGATPKSLFTDDIIGTTRGPADLDWDIGAFELVAAPVGNAGIMTTNAGFWGPTF